MVICPLAVRVLSPEVDDSISVADPQIQQGGHVEVELGDGSQISTAQTSFTSSAYAG